MYCPSADIHLGRLKANFSNLTGQVGNSKVLAVVKADGYGHGLVPISKALVEAGVYGLGVATFQEALELRKAGLRQTILHMGRFDPVWLDKYIAEDIRMSVHEAEDVTALSVHHEATSSNYSVHLKVDTGMTRLGVPYEAAVEVLEKVKQLPFIRCEGIWTHFATAGESDQSYLRFQLLRFNQFIQIAQKLRIEVEFFHAANSGAIFQEPESHLNMVRPGLILYGVLPSEHVKVPYDLQPVMDLKAPLVAMKDIPKGMPIGYGREYYTDEDMRVGTLQMGYADGLPVALSNKGHAQLGGKVHRILGRISMDLCSIDLNGGTPEIGEEVLIWGLSTDPRMRVEHQAGLAGTSPYELLVRIGRRVERHYVDD